MKAKDGVGATLLFAERRSLRLYAVLKSYVLAETSSSNVAIEADHKGRSQEWGHRHDGADFFMYLGIQDIFCVDKELHDGCFVGRSTLWTLDSERDAKSIVRQPKDFKLVQEHTAVDTSWLLANLVFYIDDKDTDLRRTIVCHALINESDCEVAIKKATVVANNPEFLQQVVNCDFEGLTKDCMKFLGLEDIQLVPEDPQTGGAFMVIEKEYGSLSQIRALRMKSEEFRGFFGE